MVDSQLVFRAMADRTRQRTLALLSRHELSVSELVEVLQQPQSTVSRHLRTLRDAGLIRDQRNGATVLYSLPCAVESSNGEDLAGGLLRWAAGQSLPTAVSARLESVLRRRRDMSDRFFDRLGAQWDTLREEAFGSWFHLEAFWALLPSRWTVADLGTGSGYLLPILAGHFQRVVAVDPVEAMLEAAAHRTQRHALSNVALCRGDLSRLPLADGSVDLALAILVLHHVPAPDEALAEMARILRPGGRMLIVEQEQHARESFRDRMQDRWSGFEPKNLLESVTRAGLENLASRRLVTVVAGEDAPSLFALTGRRPGRRNGTLAH